MPRVAKQVSSDAMRILADKYGRDLDWLKKLVDVYRDNKYPVGVAVVPFAWSHFIHNATDLSRALLGSKEIPPGQAKPLEVAVRAVLSSKRGPNDVVKWYDANRKHLDFLYDAARTWPERADESAQVFRVGPFVVHNTLGLPQDKLEGVITALEKAVVLIKGMKVPGIEKVLYGDVMIVGSLHGSNTLAFYYADEDVVYLRPIKNAGTDELHNLIHELGHRYIHKIADTKTVIAWRRYHTGIRFQHTSVDIKPGDIIPVRVKGVKGDPIVERVVPGAVYFQGLSGFFSMSDIKKVMHEHTAYPTPYASKSESEHFCEALALRAMGKLKEPHLTNFKAIIEEGKEPPPMKLGMATTYVQISRDELEEWLDDIRLHAKWHLQPGKVGTYVLPLSDTVAIKLSSTIGSSDDAMGRGQASMQLALISTVTGQVINKKAQGQTHFARTTNWRKNWLEGIERMRDAYMKSQGFYDALAGIKDRDRYKDDILKAIESVPDWRNHHILSDFHTRVENDGILTTKQRDLLDRTVNEATSKPAESTSRPEDPLLPVLRTLWVKARASNDEWLMEFTKSVGEQVKRGRPLSDKQQAIVDKNRARYRVAHGDRLASLYLRAGGTDFYTYVPVPDAKRAFREAQEDARDESGSGGYTGTIAEKSEFKIKSLEKRTIKEAYAWAYDHVDQDKWGPAFAIPVSKTADGPTIGWLFFGIASS